MTTKFDIGEKVWFMFCNEPQHEKIKSIEIDKKSTIYTVTKPKTKDYGLRYTDDSIFRSKEELKEKVFG